MLAVVITTAPVPMQLALLLFSVVGIGLALHENGWLAYLRDRRVVGVLAALVLALLFSQTIHASYYDLSIYCTYAWWDFWSC